jgi:hypothetical protein
MAPEVLKLQHMRGRNAFDGIKADIFSLGVTLFFLGFQQFTFLES